MNDHAEPALDPTFVPVCAIGASAGGVAALQDLFRLLPTDLGLAYVVILHLSPDQPSALSDILATRTRMPVFEIHDGPTLRPDCVYVIPPDRELVIEGDKVTARAFSEPRGQRAPIDMFFRSVAAARGDGVAVVLSGAGSDGALGVRAIKEGGGVIMVQEPAEAAFPSMPQSAVAAGVADFVAPIARLAERLAEVARSKEAVRSLDVDSEANDLRRIVAFLRVRTGHDFSSYKRATVMRRVARRMQVCGAGTLAAYAEQLVATPEEANELLSDLLISVTMFFRDPRAFEALERHAIGPLFDDLDPESEDGVRAWVVGCATGEEAYAVAILLHEEAARRKLRVPIQIFASDLDERALATAREGRYLRSIEADVSEERLARFFIDEGAHYRVRKELRDCVVFTGHSVVKEPPFMRLDLITCRNLLIYLERSLQQQLCSIFHFGLKRGRYLFLGSAETTDAAADLFAVLDRDARIYCARPHTHHALPVLPQFAAPERLTILDQPARSERSGTPAALHALALERIAPASVLVDSDHNIVHLSPTAGRFILHSAGPVSRALPAVVRPELRLDLGLALARALDADKPTLTHPAIVAFEGGDRRVAMHVSPVSEGPHAGAQALVFFLDGGDVSDAKDAAPDGRPDGVRRLQAELKAAQEALIASRGGHEAAIQDLRTTNEELQSINEEYRSAAEELETSKEELQSINEELHTVNAELKSKLASISVAHSDLQNLTATTEIGTLFLDSDLRIRMFTPPIAELFNIGKGDIGRLITNFTHRLDYDRLEEDARRVLKDLAPIENEVRSRSGRLYTMRLRPYRTIEDRIDGVVAAFVDVTDRTMAETALRKSEERFRAMVDNVPVLIWETDEDGLINVNGHYLDFFGVAVEGVRGMGWAKFLHPDDAPGYLAAYQDAFARRLPYKRECRFRRADGSYRWLQNSGGPVGERLFVGASLDVSELFDAQQSLRESEARFQQFAEASSDVLWIRDAGDLRFEFVSRAFERTYGLDRERLFEDGHVGHWIEMVDPADRRLTLDMLDKVAGGERVEFEFRIERPDGETRWIQNTDFPLLDRDGRVQRIGGIAHDITDERATAARMEVLVAELQHRTRNLLGVVQALVDQSISESATFETFRRSIHARLGALGRVNGLLSRLKDGDRIPFDELIDVELTAIAGGNKARQVTLEGPKGVRLRSATVQTLALALHELATNAVKYGALSDPEGRLSVSWRSTRETGKQRWLHIDWRERGVALDLEAAPSAGGGYGRRLIEQALPYQLGATVDYRLAAEGLTCAIGLPISDAR